MDRLHDRGVYGSVNAELRSDAYDVSVDEVDLELKTGEMTLREAIDQPSLWIVDVAHSGTVREAWSPKLCDLPSDVLPKPGTMLWAFLESPLETRA